MSEALSSICRTSRYPIVTILLSEALLRNSFIPICKFSSHLSCSDLFGKIHSNRDYPVQYDWRCGPFGPSFNCRYKITAPLRQRPPQPPWNLSCTTRRLSSSVPGRHQITPADMDWGRVVWSYFKWSKNIIRLQTCITSTTLGQRRIDISTSRISKGNLRSPIAGPKAQLWSWRVASSLKTIVSSSRAIEAQSSEALVKTLTLNDYIIPKRSEGNFLRFWKPLCCQRTDPQKELLLRIGPFGFLIHVRLAVLPS